MNIKNTHNITELFSIVAKESNMARQGPPLTPCIAAVALDFACEEKHVRSLELHLTTVYQTCLEPGINIPKTNQTHTLIYICWDLASNLSNLPLISWYFFTACETRLSGLIASWSLQPSRPRCPRYFLGASQVWTNDSVKSNNSVYQC